MKILRTIFLLLLCAMLPLSGLAATGLAGECPMQQSASMHDDDGAMSVDMPGCNMMKSPTAGKAKGVLCKITAQCQFASIYYPPAQATVSHPMAVSNQVVFHYAECFAGREPGGLWRPPRAI
ncbi:hypothetical protein [Paraburkholderia caribensis]|uniref:hypothetical protein n=1 Tax=Paraburkholderia caribensis TaxID=75105 RepID=UPI00078E5F41|nr:hypothetical protein [Paraburkholderia caribensis]AMV45828.1 hypothetical protein ATN79_28180 [Paraburkholderia caribensis]MDR6383771.1 hypothetical protein [Paraburkholderia caribensis]CAG9195574.1 conserved exported hypothetical protein [Paraburkholderia caribensis]